MRAGGRGGGGWRERGREGGGYGQGRLNEGDGWKCVEMYEYAEGKGTRGWRQCEGVMEAGGNVEL